jgi:NAD(P)-dependent dehydrogenase (short-subunit alcohol dehydrogenase family)
VPAEATPAPAIPAKKLCYITPSPIGVVVRRVAAFLLSDHAVIIRGQAINVDGGDTPY